MFDHKVARCSCVVAASLTEKAVCAIKKKYISLSFYLNCVIGKADSDEKISENAV